MGILLSKVRKKKSTIETLEKLDNDIKEIEENRANAQKKYRRITKFLLAFSVGMYILCGIIFYFHFTSTLKEKLLYLVPVAASPLLLYFVRKIISWYFVRLLNNNQTRLNEMKKEKKRILDEVMDKETYKVAKQILEKFSEESAHKPNYSMQLASGNPANNGLRRRPMTTTTTATMASNMSRMQSPMKSQVRSQPVRPNLPGSSPYAKPATAPPAPMMRFPAPILSLQRSYMDRVVGYLIGDGPNNRYALICSQCHSHNGMALKEEFEYIGFKCCYCFHYNPARKIKPEAPKLETSFKLKRESESDSDKTSGENSDAEHKAHSAEGSPDLVKNLSASPKLDSDDIVGSQPPEEGGKASDAEDGDADYVSAFPGDELTDSKQPEAKESNTDCDDESLVKS